MPSPLSRSPVRLLFEHVFRTAVLFDICIISLEHSFVNTYVRILYKKECANGTFPCFENYLLLHKSGIPVLLFPKVRNTARTVLFKYNTYPARCSGAADNPLSVLPA